MSESIAIPQPRRAWLRRLLGWLGTALIVGGVLVLVWAFVVWRWNDPFTAVYTTYEQHHLRQQYESHAHTFEASLPTVRAPSLTAERRGITLAAGRYRRSSSVGEGIGRITVPRLGLKMILVNGTDHDSLTRGPGRDLETYMPGQGQLIYIAGHRTTYLAPFAHIERMRPGDLITLAVPYGTFVYRVYTHVIVPADDLAVLRTHGREVVALQACHPRFFATNRYIVYGRLVKVTPVRGEPYTVTAHGSPVAPKR